MNKTKVSHDEWRSCVVSPTTDNTKEESSKILTDDDEPEDNKHRKMSNVEKQKQLRKQELNRIAARNHRNRRKALIHSLADQVNALKAQIKDLNSNNAKLKQQMKQLQLEKEQAVTMAAATLLDASGSKVSARSVPSLPTNQREIQRKSSITLCSIVYFPDCLTHHR